MFKEVDKELEEAKKDGWPEMSEIISDMYKLKLEETRGLAPWTPLK